MSNLTDLARLLAPGKTDQKTPVQASPNISAGLGIAESVNADGTIQVTFNGATFAANAANGFVPTSGESVLLLSVGSQTWVIGSASGGAASQWGEATTAKFIYDGNPNGFVTAEAAGDVCVDTVTPALWQAPAPGTVWVSPATTTSGGTGTGIFRVSQGWSIIGAFQDTTVAPIPPRIAPSFSAQQSMKLVEINYVCGAGASQFELQLQQAAWGASPAYGVAVGGINVTTTPTTTAVSIPVAARDLFQLYLHSIYWLGVLTNLAFSMVFEITT